jgi:hypothetical protein
LKTLFDWAEVGILESILRMLTIYQSIRIN